MTQFSADEREILARCEHDLWVEEREESGWTYYPHKDVELQRSPYIAPWEQIPEEIRQYDYNTADELIGLVSSVGFKVCRRKRTLPERPFRYHTGNDYPLIVSVTGHMSLTEDSIQKVQEGSLGLFNDLRKRYPNTYIILLSALAEGADRIVARVAMNAGIEVAPVIPMEYGRYVQTFDGYGYDTTEESVQDFYDLLEGCLSPCILDCSGINEIQAFRRLGAYLVSNSHILMAAWDGVASDYKGGAYDTLRMAYAGVDLDLLDFTSARCTVSADTDEQSVSYLNSNEDTLIYWVKVERGPTKKRYTPETEQSILPMRDCVSEGCDFTRPVFVDSLMRTADNDSGEKETPAGDRISITPGEWVRLVDSVPDQYDSMFKKIDGYNSDSKACGYDPESAYVRDGCGLLPGDDLSAKFRSDKLMKDMACRFGIADHLASECQRRSRREVVILTYITAFYTVLFNLMILFSDSILFLLGYGILYGLAIAFTWRHNKGRNHSKSVEYRSLAESLRIEFYWSILRLRATTSDNSYGYLKNGMSWMRGFMKSAQSAFTNDYSMCAGIDAEVSIDYVKDKWIRGQIEYGKAKADRDLRHYGILSDTSSALKILISFLTVCTIAMIVLIPELSKEVIATPDDFINSAQLNISSYTVVKIALILSMNATTILVMRMNHIDNSSTAKVMARSMYYSAALSKLETRIQSSDHRNIQKSVGILRELGLQAITENNDWVSESAKRDFKRQRGMLNSLNKYSNKRSNPLQSNDYSDDFDDTMEE